MVIWHPKPEWRGIVPAMGHLMKGNVVQQTAKRLAISQLTIMAPDGEVLP